MIEMLKRHAIQVLRQAGHEQADVARLVGVGIRTVRRVEAEPDIIHIDDAKERERRAIGRPAKAEPFRSVVT
jgi:DNA-binding XRE family transcriptional regulator